MSPNIAMAFGLSAPHPIPPQAKPITPDNRQWAMPKAKGNSRRGVSKAEMVIIIAEQKSRILELISENGQMEKFDLAEEIGTTPATMAQRLDDLRKDGRVYCTRKGGIAVWCLARRVV